MRLSAATVRRLSGDVARFDYDRTGQKIGIVHFGIGAFHRAHQAWYTDLAMDAGERDWAICGVSLRSRSVADQLAPQDGLYTLTERSGETSATRLVGAVREVLFAPDDADAIVARIASPDCHIVSFTVTEKGYARGAGDRLDPIAARASFYPLLSRALEARQAKGLPGISLLCCDNLADNGRVLAAQMWQWLAAEAPVVRDWFDRTCRVPATMIDRIVPRATSEDLAQLEQRIGVEDRGAIFTERFSQWVIEDEFAGPRPGWERHGAQIVSSVAPYETAKLRMLNGAHSLLAYCGLKAGHVFVHEAVADPGLRALAETLMRLEAQPTIAPAPGQDLSSYADRLIDRFADPALRHGLAQIAMDGTQKIPQRWLDTVLWHGRNGSATPAIAEAFEAWVWHIADGRHVDDPFGASLQEAFAAGGRAMLLHRCCKDGAHGPAIWPGHADAVAMLRTCAKP